MYHDRVVGVSIGDIFLLKTKSLVIPTVWALKNFSDSSWRSEWLWEGSRCKPLSHDDKTDQSQRQPDSGPNENPQDARVARLSNL